jgi:hypothetical protein
LNSPKQSKNAVSRFKRLNQNNLQYSQQNYAYESEGEAGDAIMYADRANGTIKP